MKSFHFPLERVLGWRRTELEQAEVRFKQEAAVLTEIDRQSAELEAAGLSMETKVRAWRPVSGSDLTALGAFRTATQKREEALRVHRAQCEKELSVRQNAMLEARRRLKLLERLKERRLGEWRAECDRELEQEGSEAYLAGWGR